MSARAQWITLVAMTLANSMILVDQTGVPLAIPEAVGDLGSSLDAGPGRCRARGQGSRASRWV